MEVVEKPHYSLDRKRAAVDVYREVKRLRDEDYEDAITPIALAQVASGGAAPAQIYRWLHQDLSNEAQENIIRPGGRSRALSDDHEALLVGFAVSRRLSLETVSLETLQLFCENYLKTKPSEATLSRIMSRYGFTSQKALGRAPRLTTEDVVEDAIDTLEVIRGYEYPPHRIICMDETGLWSNVASPRTYHFCNWYAILLLLCTCPFG
jgi:hypothetical protein